jgi:L-histidine N-alpha-methyltransferase
VSSRSLERFQLDVYLNEEDLRAAMAADVRRGLTATQKTIPPKYFYDDTGSELFERITELPEYYQTRTELAILQSAADGLAEDFAFNEVVELGSGSSKKTVALLDALDRHGHLHRFLPFDVNREMVGLAAGALLERYPALQVYGVVGDFQRDLAHVPSAEGRRLVMFLGGTIGNLNGDERRVFLDQVSDLIGDDGRLLLGVDLVKDRARLEAAYDDSAGVTAAFNRNVLHVVNRELGADFRVHEFRHWAFYNASQSRIEMHLVPDTIQQAYVRDLDLPVTVRPGETIWTEISCKFTEDAVRAELGGAGLRLDRWFTDPEGLFAVVLAKGRE